MKERFSRRQTVKSKSEGQGKKRWHQREGGRVGRVVAPWLGERKVLLPKSGGQRGSQVHTLEALICDLVPNTAAMANLPQSICQTLPKLAATHTNTLEDTIKSPQIRVLQTRLPLSHTTVYVGSPRLRFFIQTIHLITETSVNTHNFNTNPGHSQNQSVLTIHTTSTNYNAPKESETW